MSKLNNIQNAIFEVLSLIKGVPNIRKLVYYDSKDALSLTLPTQEAVANHFTVSAVFDVTEPPFDKNTIISVILGKGNYDEELVLLRAILKITVLTRSGLWELDNNIIRPLEISNLIIEILNNQKISTSHKLVLSSIDLAVLNEDVNGYTLIFFLEEGSGFDGQF